jgi:hypothetical protein
MTFSRCKNKYLKKMLNDDEVRFVLDQHAELDFDSASSMKQQSAWYMSLYADILSWFWANHAVTTITHSLLLQFTIQSMFRIISFFNTLIEFIINLKFWYTNVLTCRYMRTYYPDSEPTMQSLFFLPNAACLAEKQQIPISSSLIWPDRVSNPWSTALEASTPSITRPMRLNSK